MRLGRPRGGVIRGGKVLGKIEEYFLEQLTQGDTFRFAGRVLRFEGIRENVAYVSPSEAENPMIPSYEGGKFPLTTYLASQVREILADPQRWAKLPTQVCEWLQYPAGEVACCPGPSELLVETFPRGDRFYMVAYTFEGRLAHQTLGMLLTRRLERARARPLGFSATDYSLAVWGLRDLGELFEAGKPSLADALRRGHARRRPRGVAGRVLPPEAHVSELRHHLRPDRAPASGRGEDRPAGHRLDRPRLRRAAHATSPTTSSCRRRAPTRRPASSTSSGSAKCSFA